MKEGDRIRFVIPTEHPEETELVREGVILRVWEDGWMDVRVSGRIFNVKQDWVRR